MATDAAEGSQSPLIWNAGCSSALSSMRRPMMPRPMMAIRCLVMPAMLRELDGRVKPFLARPDSLLTNNLSFYILFRSAT
jgi:hypothetical protein